MNFTVELDFDKKEVYVFIENGDDLKFKANVVTKEYGVISSNGDVQFSVPTEFKWLEIVKCVAKNTNNEDVFCHRSFIIGINNKLKYCMVEC